MLKEDNISDLIIAVECNCQDVIVLRQLEKDGRSRKITLHYSMRVTVSPRYSFFPCSHPQLYNTLKVNYQIIANLRNLLILNK